MNWMKKWRGVSGFVARAKAPILRTWTARVCGFVLGDTGAMTGIRRRLWQRPSPTRVREGITLNVATEDSLWVGEELKRRLDCRMEFAFEQRTGCEPVWIALPGDYAAIESARLQLLLSRTVDEVVCDDSRRVVGPRRGNIGPQ